jgi:hypothetical protein
MTFVAATSLSSSLIALSSQRQRSISGCQPRRTDDWHSFVHEIGVRDDPPEGLHTNHKNTQYADDKKALRRCHATEPLTNFSR